MRIAEVVEKVKEKHLPLERKDTVDKVKYGDAESMCTGVAVTCFASVDVIQKAAESGANLIIVHEPLFTATGTRHRG